MIEPLILILIGIAFLSAICATIFGHSWVSPLAFCLSFLLLTAVSVQAQAPPVPPVPIPHVARFVARPVPASSPPLPQPRPTPGAPSLLQPSFLAERRRLSCYGTDGGRLPAWSAFGSLDWQFGDPLDSTP
jgi:hypothetical protein